MRAATRRSVVQIHKEVGKAVLGDWRVGREFSVPFGLAPFVKSREDVSVLMRNPRTLKLGQPIEFSGFSAFRALRAAEVLNSKVDEDGIGVRFGDLVTAHPSLVSFPPDLTWLAHKESVDKFVEGLKRILPDTEQRLTPVDSDRIATEIGNLLVAHPRSFTFWSAITKKDPATKTTHSRHLIDYALTISERIRSRFLAPLVPMLDARTPNSAVLSHKFNLAYANVVADRFGEGVRSPLLLYSLPFNSNTFDVDGPSEMQSTAERNVSAALGSGLFEGIWIAIRGLSRISLVPSRVRAVEGLVSRLSAIAKGNGSVLWWSRPGLIGLRARDLGCALASFSLNLGIDDVYIDGGMSSDQSYAYGRVLNAITRSLWGYPEVRTSLDSAEPGLPDLAVCRSIPDQIELQSPQRYRVGFSKPYNVSAMNWLESDWVRQTEQGEVNPGAEFLQTFQKPFDRWGTG
jgi:hypothetical protein